MQDARLSSEAFAREQRDAWQRAAFVGYQTARAFGALKGEMTFGRYLESVGLVGDEPAGKRVSLKEEIAEARAVTALAREAFKRGVVRATVPA